MLRFERGGEGEVEVVDERVVRYINYTEPNTQQNCTLPVNSSA